MLVLTALKRFAQFSGRSGRAEFWQFIAAYAATLTVVAVVESGTYAYQASGTPTLTLLVLMVGALPSYAVAFRRLHDRDLSGWIIGAQWLLNAIWFTVDHFRNFTRGSIVDLPFALVNGIDLLLTVGVAGYVLYQLCQPGDAAANAYGPPPSESTPDAEASAGRSAMEPPLAPPASDNDPLAMIERLSRLREQGVLSQAEFDQQKAALLAKLAS